ncbi:MAG TPA: hypothetical protein VMO24_04635, partial [Woeseiaceae bacterium]|nr:hypothetical protein [Woeseiaceae bacterium]
MNANRFYSLLLPICLSLLVAVGCSDKSGAPVKEAASTLTLEDSILGYIPADSPYVFAAAEPLPDDVRDEIEAKSAPVTEAYRKLLRIAARSRPNDSEEDDSQPD